MNSAFVSEILSLSRSHGSQCVAVCQLGAMMQYNSTLKLSFHMLVFTGFLKPKGFLKSFNVGAVLSFE